MTMKPLEILKHEHKVILLVVEAAECEAQSIKKAGKVNAERIAKMVDFIRNFADKCHHAKEENQLFVIMEQHSFSMQTGPIAVMLSEHDKGRQMAKTISDSLSSAADGDKDAIRVIADNLRDYARLLRLHIEKEDNILYAMADSVLTDEEQKMLSEAFEKIENDEIGKGVHEKYHTLAHELSNGGKQ